MLPVKSLSSVYSIREMTRNTSSRQLSAEANLEEHHGFAVAVSRHHLLTAFHCVRGFKYKNFTFYQPTSNLRLPDADFRVVKHCEDPDLAILETTAELPYHSPVIGRGEVPGLFEKTYLANDFGGGGQIDVLRRSFSAWQDLDDMPQENVVGYKTQERHVTHGFSGSPIFTKDGKVASITTAINSKHQDFLRAVSDVTAHVGMRPRAIPFFGVSPQSLVQFMKSSIN